MSFLCMITFLIGCEEVGGDGEHGQQQHGEWRYLRKRLQTLFDEVGLPGEALGNPARDAMATSVAPVMRKRLEKGDRLSSTSQGATRATMKSCMSSMPRLKPRMLTASGAAESWRSVRAVAKARPWTRPKAAATWGSRPGRADG